MAGGYKYLQGYQGYSVRDTKTIPNPRDLQFLWCHFNIQFRLKFCRQHLNEKMDRAWVRELPLPHLAFLTFYFLPCLNHYHSPSLCNSLAASHCPCVSLIHLCISNIFNSRNLCHALTLCPLGTTISWKVDCITVLCNTLSTFLILESFPRTVTVPQNFSWCGPAPSLLFRLILLSLAHCIDWSHVS